MIRIAIIGEGEKTEKRIIDNLQKNFPFRNNIEFVSFKADIYQLWQQLKNDPDLDLIVLLREKNQKALRNLTSKDFSEIFLFFDFDSHALMGGHYNKDLNTVFTELLAMFNDSTELGQLYISYPMVESLWSVYELSCKKTCDDCICTEETYAEKYKGAVKENSIINKNIDKFTKNEWDRIIRHFAQKTCCLFDAEKYDTQAFTQEQTYKKQYQKYYKPKKSIMTLSAFHFFLFYYFGQKLYKP
ncbi:MAG: hypothetical protein LBV04_09665 [Deferribacteraceae bacterium]|jgi:hypothetical protein|nr:hypothetical protein [Deferribacteraceae bacterium]